MIMFVLIAIMKGKNGITKFLLKIFKRRNKMLTDKEFKRLAELEEKATTNYLERSDFNPSDWLDDEESLEYVALVELHEAN